MQIMLMIGFTEEKELAILFLRTPDPLLILYVHLYIHSSIFITYCIFMMTSTCIMLRKLENMFGLMQIYAGKNNSLLGTKKLTKQAKLKMVNCLNLLWTKQSGKVVFGVK